MKKAAISPRPPCLFCVRKHIGQAAALFQEALQGYSEHRWLAIGHLAEAEAEAEGFSKSLANLLRKERKRSEESNYTPNFIELLREVNVAEGNRRGFTGARGSKSFVSVYDEDSYPRNLREVNAYLRKNGMPRDQVIRKGSGYYYVDGPDTAGWPSTSIYVYRATDMSFGMWKSYYEQLVDESRRYGGIRRSAAPKPGKFMRKERGAIDAFVALLNVNSMDATEGNFSKLRKLLNGVKKRVIKEVKMKKMQGVSIGRHPFFQDRGSFDGEKMVVPLRVTFTRDGEEHYDAIAKFFRGLGFSERPLKIAKRKKRKRKPLNQERRLKQMLEQEPEKKRGVMPPPTIRHKDKRKKNRQDEKSKLRRWSDD
jgi:hypothetical protein